MCTNLSSLVSQRVDAVPTCKSRGSRWHSRRCQIQLFSWSSLGNFQFVVWGECFFFFRAASQGMFFRIVVLNRVSILSIFVLNWVRVWGAGPHLPTQGYIEYPPPPGAYIYTPKVGGGSLWGQTHNEDSRATYSGFWSKRGERFGPDCPHELDEEFGDVTMWDSGVAKYLKSWLLKIALEINMPKRQTTEQKEKK